MGVTVMREKGKHRGQVSWANLRRLQQGGKPTRLRRLGAVFGALALVAGGSVGAATSASATTQGPTSTGLQKPYSVAVWAMPAWVDSTHPTWPQTLVGSVSSNTANLAAADGIIPTTCGTQYQVDVYYNNETTTSLLKGGKLFGPNTPPESLAPGSWGTAYKLVKNQDCPEAQTVTPAAPTFTDATCDNDGGSYTIPSTPGVDYQVNGKTVPVGTYPATGKVTIKAVAQAGYVLQGDTSWSHKFQSAEDCERVVVPKAPTVVTSECTEGQQSNGSYTIPFVEGVTYKVDGSVTQAGPYTLAPGQQVTIIAFPEPGFTFGEDAVHSWTLSNPKLDCSVPQPPATLPTVIGPGPANPQAEVGATCAKAYVELKNLTPQTTDLPATFQIAVNGTAWKTVTVQAGETEKLVYTPTSNPYTVTVTADTMSTVTGTTTGLSCVEAVVIPGTKPPAVEPAVVPAAVPAELPHTGAGSLPLALAGAGLLLLGTVLVASTRRRRGDLAA